MKARAGTIVFDGEDITNLPPHKIVARGIAQSPEGRMVFANLTVMENLRMGAYLRRDNEGYRERSRLRLRHFPAPSRNARNRPPAR